MVTSSAQGNMATYFRGLLGVDGCIQVFDGDMSCMGEHGYVFWGLLGVDGCIQVFDDDKQCMGEGGYMFLGTPWDGWLYSDVWRCEDMAAAFCLSIVCLSYLVPFGEICSA